MVKDDIIADYIATVPMDPYDKFLWTLYMDPENLFYPYVKKTFPQGKTRVDILLCALKDLGRLEQENFNGDYDFKVLKIELRFLRTFVIYVEKLNPEENGSLISLLDRFDSSLPEKAADLFVLYLRRKEADYSRFHDLPSSFHEIVDDLKPEVHQVLQKYSAESNQFTVNELFEFLDSISENLKDLIDWGKDYIGAVEDIIHALEDKLRFLGNFIYFAILLYIEKQDVEDLLVHTQAIANNAARFSCMWWICKEKEDFSPELKLLVSQLLQEFKLSEPHVQEMYIHVFRAAKLSGSLQIPRIDNYTLVAFIDSLLDCNRELLALTCESSSSVSATKILSEELKFWRIFLTDQWQKFATGQEEIGILISGFVCDAGIIICSLFSDEARGSLTKEMNFALTNFTERAALIKVEIANKCLGKVIRNFPSTNELGFMDFLLENLKELVDDESDSIDCTKEIIDEINEDLVFLRSFLGDTVEQRNEDEELKAIWARIIDASGKTEFVIDSFLVGDHHPDFSRILFNSIIEDIKFIKIEVLEFCAKKRYMNKTKTFNHFRPSRSSSPAMDEVVVGLEDDAETIFGRLKRGSTELDIVSIVGMPGLGKTTLAKKIYNDPSIIYHFHVRGWCCVSQGYQKRRLLLEILNQIASEQPKLLDNVSDDDLAQKVKRALKGKRYFIVLDDVWDIEAWNDLRTTFPDDVNGSRILFTSRYFNVALLAKTESKPHHLRLLTDGESWELLQEKLFPKTGCPQELSDVVMRVVKYSKGLPLAIVIVAGILATVEQNRWDEVCERLSSNILDGTNQGMELLELSYEHLPEKLKPCLLYLCSFPQDQDIPVRRLIWLWIAEGLVARSPEKSLEDIAEEYLADLVNRSLVSVSKIRSKCAGIKACRLHDLIHEFCVKKSKEANVLQLLRSYDELSGIVELEPRRLSIYSQQEEFSKSMLFIPRLRSLQFFATDGTRTAFFRDVSFIFQNFKLLNVLNLVSISLDEFLPSELELLVQLRYLALRGSMNSISSSIVRLYNLETFLLKGLRGEILLPSSIWIMTKLKHLHVDRRAGLSFSTNDRENSSVLYNLHSFSTPLVSSGHDIEELMRKMPNIQKLKCLCLESPDSEDLVTVLAFDLLTQLESLNAHSTGRIQYGIKFQFPVSLKKLTLSKFCLPWTEISAIAELPNLEVLKLLSRAFEGEMWDMTEEEFPKLIFLKLDTLNLKQWNASPDQFPSLKRLVLQSCRKLEEIPLSFGEIDTLQMIEVKWCSQSAASSAQQIFEEKRSSGNQDIKIVVNCPNWKHEDSS